MSSPNVQTTALAQPGWTGRALLMLASRLRVGTLSVTLWDGTERVVEGAGPGPGAALVIHTPRLLRRMLAGGVLGLMEAYVDGDWDSPDLAGMLELGALNEASFGRATRGGALMRLVHRLAHRMRPNDPRGARRNIADHYDLGNAFYRLWLDPTMTYSCGLFESPGDDLETAQRNKYRRILERLRPGPDDHILEIGSGWGGFALHAARETGCRVTGLTLSREQLAVSRRRAEAEGLADRVGFELRDYRDETRQYDHVASIEMFEAVGEAWWPAFFATLRRCLRDGGRAAMQVITIDDDHFGHYRREADFIQRYIFPGGMLPSPTAFRQRAGDAGLACRATTFHGPDYARTLAEWETHFAAAERGLEALGFDRRFRRLWHAYLAYCQAGFRTGRIDLMQVDLTVDR